MIKPDGTVVESTSYRPRFFLLLALCFAGAVLGDSVAESLVLSHFSASIIPTLYLVNACALFLFSFFLISLVDSMDRGRLYAGFVISHALLLAGIWVAVASGFKWIYVPLFCYAYITKIFLFMLFWTLVNDVVDTRRAGRDFPFIAAGGTFGAIAISFSVPGLIHLVSAQTLLLLWSGLMGLVLVVFYSVIRPRYELLFKPRRDSIKKKHPRGLSSVKQDLALVLSEPLFVNMSILYFLLFFVLLNQHYLFYSCIRSRFITAENLASFLGMFNGISMGATFLIQISLAGIIIRAVGSTRAMFMLPVAFFTVFAILVCGLLFHAGPQFYFWGVVAGVGLRIAFFDSFFSPNFQVFFSSVPQEMRGRGKLGMEGVVKPVAMISAALWLMFIAPRLPILSNISLLLCASLAMILQTFRIKGTYTQSLSMYLADFRSRVPASLVDTSVLYDNNAAVTYVSAQLRDPSFEIRAYTIELLADMKSEDAIAQLAECLDDSDARTRAAVVSALARFKRPELKNRFIHIFRSDTDDRVVANTVFALAAYNEQEINGLLYGCIRHHHNRVRSNTIIAMWPLVGHEMRAGFVDILQEMLSLRSTPQACSSALYAMREIGTDRAIAEIFMTFATSQQQRISENPRIWHHFLRFIGFNPSREAIAMVFEMAVDGTPKRKAEAVTALVESLKSGYDPSALYEYLLPENRRFRSMTLAALRGAHPLHTLGGDEKVLVKTAEDEHKEIYRHWYNLHAIRQYGRRSPGLQLLSQAILEECIHVHIDNLCSIAALLDKQGLIQGVARRLFHDDRHVRARAMEVFDNTGNIRVNRWIIELLETESSMHHFENARALYRFREDIHDTAGILKWYIHQSNKWVADCAAYAYNLDKIGK